MGWTKGYLVHVYIGMFYIHSTWTSTTPGMAKYLQSKTPKPAKPTGTTITPQAKSLPGTKEMKKKGVEV
jgi:hypothetical protein